MAPTVYDSIATYIVAGEPRNHKILDNKRNGVVGNKGRKIPITPKHREILPKTIYMTFTSQKYNKYRICFIK